jgi:hypothetical protein
MRDTYVKTVPLAFTAPLATAKGVETRADSADS